MDFECQGFKLTKLVLPVVAQIEVFPSQSQRQTKTFYILWSQCRAVQTEAGHIYIYVYVYMGGSRLREEHYVSVANFLNVQITDLNQRMWGGKLAP